MYDRPPPTPLPIVVKRDIWRPPLPPLKSYSRLVFFNIFTKKNLQTLGGARTKVQPRGLQILKSALCAVFCYTMLVVYSTITWSLPTSRSTRLLRHSIVRMRTEIKFRANGDAKRFHTEPHAWFTTFIARLIKCKRNSRGIRGLFYKRRRFGLAIYRQYIEIHPIHL